MKQLNTSTTSMKCAVANEVDTPFAPNLGHMTQLEWKNNSLPVPFTVTKIRA